eukprot:883575_1
MLVHLLSVFTFITSFLSTESYFTSGSYYYIINDYSNKLISCSYNPITHTTETISYPSSYPFRLTYYDTYQGYPRYVVQCAINNYYWAMSTSYPYYVIPTT